MNFDVALPLRALFEAPTIAELAARVELIRRSGEIVQILPIMPVPRDRDLPLSFAQQRLWFIHQLEPGSSLYNVQTTLRLKGQLDMQALQDALEEIVLRHEVLRTHFAKRGDLAVQVISEEKDFPLPIIDFVGTTAPERFNEVRRLCSEEANRPFDLTKDRPIRGCLLRLEEEDHLLLLILHHIATDGWSLGVLTREINALYSAFRNGESAPLSPLPIQYADYAVWQRAWLQGDELERQAAYWKSQLAGAPPRLQLPTDRPRETANTYQGSSVRLNITSDVGQGLRHLGQEERATQFMVLLAAYNVLLHQYTGQEDIVVGTDTANRGHHAIEGLIGFFMNHLALRTDLSGNPTFRELVRRVRAMALEAFTHQDLPFDKLVELMVPERNLSHTPIFQSLFVMQPPAQPQEPDQSLYVTGINTGSMTSKYEISVFLMEGTDGLIGSFVYREDLFDPETVRGMASDFEAIVQAAAAEPNITVSELKGMLFQLAARRSAVESDLRRQANRIRLRTGLSRNVT
jgi:hypothetical protein